MNCSIRRRAALALIAATAPLQALAVPWSVTVEDAAGKPLSNAVVAVLVKGQHTVAPKGTVSEIGQKSRQFTPQVTVVQTGTAVQFPNFDTVRHHVYSFSQIQRFELKLYAGTPSTPVVFDKAGTATLGCNIHDRMEGWVHVVDTPLFAQTDANGVATLDVPPGQHLVHVWHPLLGEAGLPSASPLKVDAGPLPATLRLAVTGTTTAP